MPGTLTGPSSRTAPPCRQACTLTLIPALGHPKTPHARHFNGPQLRHRLLLLSLRLLRPQQRIPCSRSPAQWPHPTARWVLYHSRG
eukprot:1139347-Pelagomonas_calceolata.AAC.4